MPNQVQLVRRTIALLLAFLPLAAAAAAADPGSPHRSEPLHSCIHAPDCGHADDTLKPARPTVFAVYYAWYHDAHIRSARGCTGPGPMLRRIRWLSRRSGLANRPRPARRARWSAFTTVPTQPSPGGMCNWPRRRALTPSGQLVGQAQRLDQNFERGILPAAEKEGFKIRFVRRTCAVPRHAGELSADAHTGLRRYKDNPAYLRLEGRPVVYLYQVAPKPGLTAEEFPLSSGTSKARSARSTGSWTRSRTIPGGATPATPTVKNASPPTGWRHRASTVSASTARSRTSGPTAMKTRWQVSVPDTTRPRCRQEDAAARSSRPRQLALPRRSLRDAAP